MISKCLFLICAFFTLAAPAFAQDAEGCKDHPLFNRMPKTFISSCTKSYDQLELYMANGDTAVKEGNLSTLVYEYAGESNGPSFLQIVKNYENAIAKKGGKRIFADQDAATLFLTVQGKQIWLAFTDANRVGVSQGGYRLDILEIEEMKQDIQAADILAELNKTGHIALYINFETGKSSIKAESSKIIDQVVAMLKSAGDLKVVVEGHTDNQGQAASNQKLSEDRAKAVVDAIVKAGINGSRLSSRGLGQSAPISDNKTEEGRALNRRVEIVKK